MKRNTKISCDVSREADNMLKAYCLKHERSKGFLLEKMIRKFCGSEVEAREPTTANIATVEKTKVKRFVAPNWKEVAYYMFDKQGVLMDEEANKFHDFYESNGWKVGKNKMKCWKAAVRNWLKNNNGNNQSRVGGKTSGNLAACEAFINGK